MTTIVKITTDHIHPDNKLMLRVTQYPLGAMAASPSFGRVIRDEEIQQGVPVEVTLWENVLVSLSEVPKNPDLDW